MNQNNPKQRKVKRASLIFGYNLLFNLLGSETLYISVCLSVSLSHGSLVYTFIDSPILYRLYQSCFSFLFDGNKTSMVIYSSEKKNFTNCPDFPPWSCSRYLFAMLTLRKDNLIKWLFKESNIYQ